MLGNDDPCCGVDHGSGGCGKCLLISNPDSINPDWTAVVMKKNRCPPESSGCGANQPHFDIAAPGFDNLQYSTANVCGLRAGTGFTNQSQSEVMGSWWKSCSDTSQCEHLCEGLPSAYVKGCKLFASWGWTRGDPKNARFRSVECPPAFTAHIGGLFDANGVVKQSTAEPTSEPTPTPTLAQTPMPTSVCDTFKTKKDCKQQGCLWFSKKCHAKTSACETFEKKDCKQVQKCSWSGDRCIAKAPTGATPEPEPEPESTSAPGPEPEPEPEPATIAPSAMPTLMPTQRQAPTMSPSSNPPTPAATPVPTIVGSRPCLPLCSAIPGERTPECNGKSEATCKNMMQYERKCQWVCPAGGTPDTEPEPEPEPAPETACLERCSAAPGRRTPECNGQPITVCQRMIQYENKCQIVKECSNSLVDISSHAAEAPSPADDRLSKNHLKHRRFLSPWQALVQIQQMMNKSDAPLEHSLSIEQTDEL